MKKYALALLICLFTAHVEAAWTYKDGKFVDANEAPTLTVEEHYQRAVAGYEKKDWFEASHHFLVISKSFPGSPLATDASYYLGVCYYEMRDYDFANDAFSAYISGKSHPKYFIEAIEYKLNIATALCNGEKCHFFGTKQLPKWASGEELGVQIYDEVIAALPSHDFAAQALYAKGYFLWKQREYRSSIDCFQLLVKRFPKHELTPESFLAMTRVYLDQSKFEFQNSDILAFAELNLRRFQRQFPKEKRLVQAEKDVLAIKEVYASGLYETGLFYERTGQPTASIIYYKNAVQKFPETMVAKWCIKRLTALIPNYTSPNLTEEIEVLEESA